MDSLNLSHDKLEIKAWVDRINQKDIPTNFAEMTRLKEYEEIMKDDKNKNRAALKLAKLRAAEEKKLAD